jgi:hypothetical protein
MVHPVPVIDQDSMRGNSRLFFRSSQARLFLIVEMVLIFFGCPRHASNQGNKRTSPEAALPPEWVLDFASESDFLQTSPLRKNRMTIILLNRRL